MTEYELLYLIVERRKELISMIQWWGAISFGVIATSHLLDRTINLFIILLIVIFYAAFSVFVIRMAGALFDQLLMAFTDLADYAENFTSVSSQSQTMIELLTSGQLPLSIHFIVFVLWGLTIATCSYPLWRYLKFKNQSK